MLKEDLEANLRTPYIYGFELLDLHDYLGQGTALVGILDPFWGFKSEADLLIISLGTNDYRAGDVQGYIDGLTGMIAKHREGRPDVGIIIIAPPDSNGVAAEPLTTFVTLDSKLPVLRAASLLTSTPSFRCSQSPTGLACGWTTCT